MKPLDARLRSQLIIWLFAGCFLVFAMVVVGGITRLTGSGLSITEWKVITGTIPPLNEAAWQEEFLKYQQIPQFKEMNSHFTLEDFKFIYFWEYIHRLIGRMIGLFFLVGFIYFKLRNAIRKELMPRLLFMFVLGGIQGFLGWYMVSSGLTQNIRVSHIRLAIHLTFAFITFGYIFWVAMTELSGKKIESKAELSKYKFATNSMLVLVILQVIYGAFVAGTKAGWFYNTWPMMDGQWMHESISFAFQNEGFKSLIDNLASVQFIHRNLAYLITAIAILLWYKADKEVLFSMKQKNASKTLLLIVFCQVLLGIFTLLSSVPVWMGVAHQALAFFLFAATINLLHKLSYN